MEIALQQKQMLKMVMTTELRQAIELLQLSTYELLQYIQDQAEENPFIELIEKDYSRQTDYDNRLGKNSADSDVDPLEFVVNNEKSMHEYLLEQIGWLPLGEKEYKIVHYLILNINEHGYLMVNEQEIMEQLHIDENALAQAKSVLHQLEPKGIGARDLTECLTMQAEEKYPEDSLLLTLISHYLQPIADKQWHKIAKELNITLLQVKECVEKIQTLHPKPATCLSNVRIEYVQPDIYIDKDEKSGAYTIQLNDYYIPKVHFNQHFSNKLSTSKELLNYVSGHFKKYEWLQKSIEQRRTTILKIMNVIIKHQQSFLREGLRALKPLTLKDVAEEIGMHESTVSRATANKIVQTPVGTFELRHLFSTKLATSEGDNASQTKVKSILADLIEKENKYKPLSDQKIADLLKAKKGVVISRRTVAKYRDELQIPPSSKRKEIKICTK